VVVELRRDRGLPFLDVRSRVDANQSLLLPLGHRPTVSGLSLHTRLGRVHALYWGLAYGSGQLPGPALVRFESGTLRYRTAVDAQPHQLDGQYWVVAAEGVFATATLVVGDHETERVRLAVCW